MAKPDAKDDFGAISVYDSDGKVKGNLLANDDPNGSNIKVAYFDGVYVGPKGGTNTIQGDYGTFTVYENGSYTYKLDKTNPAVMALAPGEELREVVGYKITNPSGQTDYAWFVMTISGTPTRPDAVDDVFAALPNGVVLNNVLSNDSDPNGDPIQVVSAGRAGNMIVMQDGVPLVVEGTYGTLTINKDGSFSYDLNETDPDYLALAPGQKATDVFQYKIWDFHVEDNTDSAYLKFDVTGGDVIPST